MARRPKPKSLPKAAGKTSRSNIYLVGFMASGKSSVGRALAKRMGRRFIDTDMEIRRQDGRAPARIFAQSGEAIFRRLEAMAVRRVASRSNAVVALGGGALTTPGHYAILRRTGKVVYLQVPFPEIYRRGRADAGKRPLWSGGKSALERLFKTRRPAYRKAAHLTVRALGTPGEVAEKLEKKLAP